MLESDIQKLTLPPIVQLFVLSNYTPDPAAVLRFTNEPQTVRWQGQIYQSLPVEVDGFEFKNSGSLPRPRIRLSNIGNLIASLIAQYNDLIGARLTRKRTLATYLDDSPTADPTAEFPDDIYYIQQKTEENKRVVEWELASILDLEGLQLPRRRIISSTCLWQYRSSECGYTGPPVATITDTPTQTEALDRCGKRLESCKMRFSGVLPFGAFPGVVRYQ